MPPSCHRSPVYHRVLRRAAAAAATLVVMGASVVDVPSTLPTATAYVPWNAPSTATAKDPKSRVEITHSTVDGHDPRPGETFTYTATGTVTNAEEADASTAVQLHVTQSPKASFTSPVTASDFRFEGAQPTRYEVKHDDADPDTWSVIGYGVRGDTKVIFTKEARVKQKLGPAVPIDAKARIDTLTTITPKIDANVDNNGRGIFYSDTGETYGTEVATACTGSIENTYTVAGSGVWLADITFGDALGRGLVKIDKKPLTNRSGKTGYALRNTISIITDDGRDITDSVLNAPGYEYQPETKMPPGVTDPNTPATTVWHDSMNWHYDPSKYTGDVFLPHGTRIKIRKGVTYRNCTPGAPGVPVDLGGGTTNRRVVANITLARRNAKSVETSIDSFATPGPKPSGFTCDGLSSVAGYHFGKLTPVAGSDSFKYVEYPEKTKEPAAGTPQPFEVDALASRVQDPEWYYYYGIKRIEMQGGTHNASVLMKAKPGQPNTAQVVSDGPVLNGKGLSSNPVRHRPFALAADKNGVLWTIGRGTTNDSSAAIYKYYPDYKTTQKAAYKAEEKRGAQLKDGWAIGNPTTGSYMELPFGRHKLDRSHPYSYFDLAFDGNGGIYALNHREITRANDRSNSNGRLVYWSPEQVKNTLPGRHIPRPAVVARYRDQPFGIAFARDGKGQMQLYVANLDGDLSKVNNYTSRNEQGSFSRVPYADVNNERTKDFGDLGGCAFPGAIDHGADTPKFVVQKSAIDPVTGKVLAPGTSSTNGAAIDSDGTFNLWYQVQVRNISSVSDYPHPVVDTVTVPEGFELEELLVDGKSQGTKTTFKLYPGKLGPSNPVRTFLIHARLKVTDFEHADWHSAGTCDAEHGDKTKGFYNAVTNDRDSDGDKNNRACIPVTPPKRGPQLVLRKKIVDPDGRDVSTESADINKFTLSADGPVEMTGTDGVSREVLSGRYFLHETASDGLSGYYQYGSWSCEQGGKPLNVDSHGSVPSVEVPPADSVPSPVVCTVANTRQPLFHVVKTATDPQDADNPHIGKTVTPDSSGNLTARYTISVTSDSSFAGDTKGLFDRFTAPEGLVWDGDRTATVTFNDNGTGAHPVDFKSQLTRDELHHGATLATAIKGVPAHGSVSFDIAIPLKLDRSPASDGGETVFSKNAEKLRQCTRGISSGGSKFATETSGIPNLTELGDENEAYSDIPEKDNVACVPVNTKPSWKVRKVVQENGRHIGERVPVDPGTHTAVLNYTVVATNTGLTTSARPEIRDELTLHGGFGEVVELHVSRRNRNGGYEPIPNGELNWSRGSTSFTIPAAPPTRLTSPNEDVQFHVRATVQPKNPAASVNWDELTSCEANGSYALPGKGFVNTVSMKGDSDGKDNNVACIPAQPPTRLVTIKKFDGNNTPLAGAEFTVYPDSGNKPDESNPITPQIDTSALPRNTFTVSGLQVGKKYWLKETRAPYTSKETQRDAYELLPRPVQFELGPAGVLLCEDGTCKPALNNSPSIVEGGLFEVYCGENFVIRVHDPRAMTLPKSGGFGEWPYALGGMALIALAAWATRRRGEAKA